MESSNQPSVGKDHYDVAIVGAGPAGELIMFLLAFIDDEYFTSQDHVAIDRCFDYHYSINNYNQDRIARSTWQRGA